MLRVQQQRAVKPAHAILLWLTALLVLLPASLAFGQVVAAVHGAPSAHALLSDPQRSPLLNDPTWIALGTLVNEASALVAVLVWWWWLRVPREKLGARPVRPTAVLGALLLVFGIAPWAETVGELVHRVVQNDVTSSKVVSAAARGASDAELVLLLFALAIVPAIVEELMFRGLMTAGFRSNLVVAIAVPSLLFGLFHLEPTQAAGTVLLGAGFAYARLSSDSLGVSMITHGVYNAAVLLLVRYGPAMSEHEIEVGPLLAGAVLAGAGSVLLWKVRVTQPTEPAQAMPAVQD